MGYGLKYRTVMLSANGNVFAIHDNKPDRRDEQAGLFLVKYTKATEQTDHFRLPLKSPASSAD